MKKWEWLAGIILGEGCIYLKNNKSNYEPHVAIVMGDLGTIDYIHTNFGGHRCIHAKKTTTRNETHRVDFLGSENILCVLERIRPHCLMSTEKLKQIDLMIEFCSMPNRLHDRRPELFERQKEIFRCIKALKPSNRFKKPKEI